MKTIQKSIKDHIKKYKAGTLFKTSDIIEIFDNKQVVYSTLNKLVKKNEIIRIGYGKYCIPQKTTFGVIQPSDNLIIEFIINETMKKTGVKPYFALYNIFNKLGLTTQISNDIFLIVNIKKSYSYKVKNMTIHLIAHQKKWKTKDIAYHEFLYSLENMKKIPDTTISESFEKLYAIFKKYKTCDIVRLVELVKNYKKKTQLLLGIMLELNGYTIAANEIYRSLNKKTTYKIPLQISFIDKKIKKKWKIYETT